MKEIILLSAIVSVLSAVPAMARDKIEGGDVKPRSSVDANGPNTASFAAHAAKADADMQNIFENVRSQLTAQGISAATGSLCAIVAIPGPGTSFDIRYGVFNVIAPTLDFLMVDTFRALKGQSLLTQSVFGTTPPNGGTLANLYPDGTDGKGPIVLGTTNFGQFASIAFSTDPDTYTNPDFGATVLDMNNTDIEAVYSNGTRCKGSLTFNAGLNASIANLLQVFP